MPAKAKEKTYGTSNAQMFAAQGEPARATRSGSLRQRTGVVDAMWVESEFPSGSRKRRVGRLGEADRSVVGSAVEESRAFDVSKALQIYSSGNRNNLPSRAGEWGVGRRGQTHGAVVGSPVEPAQSFDIATALKRNGSVSCTHELPFGAGEGFYKVADQCDSSVVRVAVQIARPVDVAEAFEGVDLVELQFRGEDWHSYEGH